MPRERVQNGAIGRIPHFDLVVLTAGDNALAIRRKRNRQYRPAMPNKCAQLIAVGRVPHPGGLIPTAADDPLAVRRKSHSPDAIACGRGKSANCVPVTASQTFAVLILTAGDNPLAVR